MNLSSRKEGCADSSFFSFCLVSVHCKPNTLVLLSSKMVQDEDVQINFLLKLILRRRATPGLYRAWKRRSVGGMDAEAAISGSRPDKQTDDVIS